MWTRAFWAAAAERCVKTLAQTLAALLLADGTGLLDTAWTSDLSVAGMAALLSLLTSIASGAIPGTPVGPSLTSEVLSPPAPRVED